MFKRIGLLIVTNLAILIVLGIVLQVLEALGIFDYSRLGYEYGPLLVMALLFGFGGSFLSLAMSKTIAKWSTGAKVIERPRNDAEQWLLQTVADLSRKAGIDRPEVAVYESPEPNAFATGMSKNKSFVAVSTGLLHSMGRDEVEAVLGHEISHAANGDMVTLTLIQGVLNTFVIFFSRVVGRVVDSWLSGGRERGYGVGYWVVTIAAQILFGILATIIVMWFSRWREYRADAGGARLAGRPKMIAALERLKASHEPSHLPDSMAAFGIRGGVRSGLMALFRSHPPLDARIAALRAGRG